MSKANAIIGQSGGPTSVINASLAGAVQAALESGLVDNFLGMRYGVEGLMQENIINLSTQSKDIIEGLKTTPSSALGSCRHKLQDSDLPRVFEVLQKYNIRYVFLIGGNDTMDTICRIEEYASSKGYPIQGIGIPKTVDNDLYGTDHTPGFASAARYMALSVRQAGILARDMKKVDQFSVFQCIGREAGWLAAATALGADTRADAPHIICFPERSFEKDKFLAEVERCYKEYGFVSVVCGEGITYADGTPVSASQTKDKFNNVEFGAMGGTSAAMGLHRLITDKFGFRGEFQITESLPMCAQDRAVQTDIDEAVMCGRRAVELAAEGKTGLMVTLEREAGEQYKAITSTVPLKETAIRAKPMPDEFISENGYYVTEEFIKYAKPLVGEMPEYVRLEDKKFTI